MAKPYTMDQIRVKNFADTFSRLFLESRKSFENIAFSYVHERNAAEDIVTDSFLYLWEHRNEVDWESNLKGYLYLAVRSRCVSYLRKQQNPTNTESGSSSVISWKMETSLSSLEDDSTLSRMLGDEARNIYAEELSRMPELTRAVFLASRDEGLTYQEIALRYGISVRKVTSEIQKALCKLRISLKDYLCLILLLV